MSIPSAFIDQVIDQSNIVDVIGKRLPLNKKGSNYWCKCPFHDDNNPSMAVNEDKQFFYFVHSFVASNTETSVTTTHYGEEFVSSLATENIFATQFHPEKSGEIGLKFLENFINWKI